jgi:hypothetical protein
MNKIKSTNFLGVILVVFMALFINSAFANSSLKSEPTRCVYSGSLGDTRSIIIAL